METTYTVKDLDDLPEVAADILKLVDEEGVVALYGEMGAGKTTLIRAMCERLGVADTVNSPTFAIVNHYVTAKGRNVYHFDFYRINKPEEAFDFGYEEYVFGSDLCFIEWPEKVEGILPDNIKRIDIKVNEGGVRTITVTQ